MTKGEQNIADVLFILHELQRFAAMSPGEVSKYSSQSPENFLAFLDHPTRGVLFCGRPAFDRFDALAERTIKPTSANAKPFEIAEYADAIRQAFIESFVDAARIVNQSSVARLINRAQALWSDQKVERTHHLPCTVFGRKTEPDQFTLGPVTFNRTDRFLKEFAKDLEECQKSTAAKMLESEDKTLSPADAQAKADTNSAALMNRIREYYGNHDWVASVTIPLCDENVSKTKAEQTVDAALNVLRLFFPTECKKFRQANTPNVPSETHGCFTDQTGKMRWEFRRDAKGELVASGWYSALLRREFEHWQRLGEAVEALRIHDKVDELQQRLLDALNWFGQAVIEDNPAAKIVKYTAALERLTMTGHVDKGIEELVITRVKILNQDRPDKTREQIEQDMGQIYQYRSDLMHGSRSPYDPSVTQILQKSLELTKWSIVSASILFEVLRNLGKANRKALAAEYDGARNTPQT